jgi:hypothetical protein
MRTKWVVALGFRLAACGMGLVGFCAGAQLIGRPATGPGGDTEPSRCLTGATIQVTAKPSAVTYGESGLVKWSVNLPTGCGAVHIRLNGQPVARSGSRSVTPPASTTYTVLVSETHLGVYGQTSASARIEVVGYPPRVLIDQSTSEPVRVLIGALTSNNPEQTVELCDVDLDMTGYSHVDIGADRLLIASPTCARGPRSFGPRIFVTDKRDEHTPLLVIRGDRVRFSGFRLEGPTSGIGSENDNKERGVWVLPLDDLGLIRNIEISNMEFSHWSGAGIEVIDNTSKEERGRLVNTYVGAVRIRNNYFHHNRHFDGDGYGVVVSDGGYALIEQNVFEENRHAIAGGSSNGKLDFSGYTARDNLILPGGGLHCNWFKCWQTHQIDMHGNESTFFGGDWCCGTAGETIIIERNTILYTGGTLPRGSYYSSGSWEDGYAIKIRGNPADKAVVDGNVFKHKSRSDAIAQNGNPGFGDNITNPIDVRPNNVFNVDPALELRSCDFFGDGMQDQFMATGVTWWAQSPVTLQWRYLNTMPERLTQLQLGNVDNDGICDVAMRTPTPAATPRTYSKNGIGPWMPVQVIVQ